MSKKGNIYDDVFKTLVKETPQLLIPLINEIFGENYTGNEEIRVLSENLPEVTDSSIDMKISDSNIAVIGGDETKYHIECQSNPDNTMVIRMFEYDIREAMRDVSVNLSNVLSIDIPKSAVIYLRSNGNTPSELKVEIHAGADNLEYAIPILKISDYTEETLFEKDLLFLLPFYFFIYENDFERYNESDSELAIFVEKMKYVLYRLQEVCAGNHQTAYTVDTIRSLMAMVAMELSSSYANVNREVDASMYGKVLDYPARTSYYEGVAKGESIGLAKGEANSRFNSVKALMENLQIDSERACDLLNITGTEREYVLKLISEQ